MCVIYISCQVCSSDAWLLGTDTGTWRRVHPQGATDADIPPAMYACVCVIRGSGSWHSEPTFHASIFLSSDSVHHCLARIAVSFHSSNTSVLVFVDIPSRFRHAHVFSFRHPRHGHTATAVDSRVYIIGGRQGMEVFGSVYCFDMTTGRWSCVLRKGVNMAHHSAVLHWRPASLGAPQVCALGWRE